VAFRAEVALALVSSVCVARVEVQLFLCISSMSADALRGHFGKEGICPFDFHEASLGVLLSQPSPFYTLESQHPASSLVRLRREVS